MSPGIGLHQGEPVFHQGAGFLLTFPSLRPFPTCSPPHRGSLYLQPISEHMSPSSDGHIHGPLFLQSQMDARLLLTRPSLDKISPHRKD